MFARTAVQWSAAAGVVTAVAAIVAIAAALVQLRDARRLRREQARPYVAVFMESSNASPQFVDLVVKNFGLTAGHDIELRCDPPLQRSTQGSTTVFEEVWLPPALPTLVPGQEWRTLWDFSPARAQTNLPERHEVHVRVKDSIGQVAEEVFILDWGAYRSRRWVTVRTIHDVGKSLRAIERELPRWREGLHGGLRVTVRDGDAKDAAELADHEAYLNEIAQAAEPDSGEDGTAGDGN